MTNEYVLGIDLGTTGVKVLLVPARIDTDIETWAQATESYPLHFPHPGWSEQDPEDWWQGTLRAIRAVLERAGVPGGQVAGLALSGQMHGATLLDRHGNVLRPCILWNDQRSAPQCAALTEEVGFEQLLALVGNPALAGFTAPKLLWVREHEPEVFARLATVLLPKDYINFRLTGELATEFSDASGTLLFDVTRRRWSEGMLEACRLPAGVLPTAYPSTAIVGSLSVEAAQLTGLHAGTPVVAGGADNACAAVGAGTLVPGQLLVSLGTSGTVIAPVSDPQVEPRGRLHTFCHAAPDTWYLMGVVLSAGGSLRWVRDTLARDLQSRAGAEGRDPYELMMEEAASVAPGSDRLIFLPYLTGERTPHGDALARGVFFGLSPVHSRAHLVRSVLEGVTFALADSLDIMRELGIQASAAAATGGGARSALWRQMLADAFAAPLRLAHAEAGPALGAAVLATVGIGTFPSVADAAEKLPTSTAPVRPRAEITELYSSYHELYDSLYPELRQAFQHLAQQGLRS